jgi:hypothetical protein
MAASDRLLCPPPELMIDPDAFNAFEAAGWQHKASTYDRVAAITSRVITPLLDAARVEADASARHRQRPWPRNCPGSPARSRRGGDRRRTGDDPACPTTASRPGLP